MVKMTFTSQRAGVARATLCSAVVLGLASVCFSQANQVRSNDVKKSTIYLFDLKTKSVKSLYSADQLLEAPNWSPDGKHLLVNTGGHLYELAVSDPNPSLAEIDLKDFAKCNNDKGYSPDGKLIALSSSQNAKGSQVYTVPVSGGTPTRAVTETPSYFHGFSPDGKWMAIVGQRSGNFDLFRIPTSGGPIERLTSDPGYDDGPDYSPDGKWIYFNSNRSGSWDIWRMPAEGAGAGDTKAQRVTDDEGEDWFPHCSPDGKWMVFLTFPHGTSTHNDRLTVQLRMMPLPTAKLNKSKQQIKVLHTFFGGQGTINVNSWAPDSSQFAFVGYQQ